jgi:hypothetical protein
MKFMSSSNGGVCQYCNKKFAKSSTLFSHVCEQKRRHLAKDEKHVVIAYQAFTKFFQLTQNSQGVKSYSDFAKSPYYNAFVKFGSFVSNTNPLYPQKFIDWVIKSGVKLDHWCKDELYEKYVVDLLMTEHAETALERTLKTMQDWADGNSAVWNSYFSQVSTNRAVYDIKDGKISPWVLLQSPSGKEMLQSFRDDQLAAIANIINPQVWVRKFKNATYETELIKAVVKEGNL